MVRRKGERPVAKTWPEWGSGWHPVRRMIVSGDDWLTAWTNQSASPWGRVIKATGIPLDRLFAFVHSHERPTQKEVEALAAHWRTNADQVLASIEMDLSTRCEDESVT